MQDSHTVRARVALTDLAIILDHLIERNHSPRSIGTLVALPLARVAEGLEKRGIRRRTPESAKALITEFFRVEIIDITYDDAPLLPEDEADVNRVLREIEG